VADGACEALSSLSLTLDFLENRLGIDMETPEMLGMAGMLGKLTLGIEAETFAMSTVGSLVGKKERMLVLVSWATPKRWRMYACRCSDALL